MDTRAFDFFLLMTSLSQLKERESIERLFLEGVSRLFPDFGFRWNDPENPQEPALEVRTRRRSYGSLGYRREMSDRAAILALVHNACQMLALILENLSQETALVEQNRRLEGLAADLSRWSELLEERVEERTRQLASTNRSLDESRRELTALNEELEIRVVRRTREIEEARAALEAFSYSVSHDLKAPLRAIHGYASELGDLLSDAEDPEVGRMIGRVLAGAERMNRLIEAILSLSRLDRHRVRATEVDIRSMVEELGLEVVQAAKGLEGEGAGERAARPPVFRIHELPPASTDADLVRQVFANLLSNAYKFTSKRDDPSIEVGWEHRSDGNWYHVKDNGTGFDPGMAGRMFQVFQRLHGSEFEGIGIGLATVKRILDRLGGSIEATSRPGEGAIFRFRLEPSSEAGCKGEDEGADRGPEEGRPDPVRS